MNDRSDPLSLSSFNCICAHCIFSNFQLKDGVYYIQKFLLQVRTMREKRILSRAIGIYKEKSGTIAKPFFEIISLESQQKC